MKKFAIIIINFMLLFGMGCGKHEPKLRDPEHVRIDGEIVLQRTGESYNMYILYSRDYPVEDEISLTVDGVPGVLAQFKQDRTLFTGRFELPATAKAGDQLVKLQIKNKKSSVEYTRILRFVDEYTLETLWDNLDKDYFANVRSIWRRTDGGNFDVNGMGGVGAGDIDKNNLPVGPWKLGTCRFEPPEYLTYDPEIPKPFIFGLNGMYEGLFDVDGSFKELTVYAIYDGTVEQVALRVIEDLQSMEGMEYVGEDLELIFNYPIHYFKKDSFNFAVHQKLNNYRQLKTVITRDE